MQKFRILIGESQDFVAVFYKSEDKNYERGNLIRLGPVIIKANIAG